MDIWNVIILSLIQGITEFLPISSSAHLVLIPALMNNDYQGVAFDVAVHVGSLLAVLAYFRHELRPLLTAWLQSLYTHKLNADSRLVWQIGFATIPVAVVGLLIADTALELWLRSPFIIAMASMGFGMLLWWSDTFQRGKCDEYSLSWQAAMIIGIAQALALIPGTSRSGITITAALLLTLNRKAAARFSFLLSIPVILLAGAHKGLGLVINPEPVDWLAITLGLVLSAISAYICIQLFIDWLERTGMLPFVIYRVLLGGLILLWMV